MQSEPISSWQFTPQPTAATVLCCVCAVEIESNSANMCVNCIRNQVDISDGLPKQVHVQFCRNCLRYNQPPGAWVEAELESKELLAFCLKKITGLNKVKLVDAGFIWTEPHSKRLKIKLTIQKEVLNGTILQQSFIIEYVVSNMMCPDCHKVEANMLWSACAQVRQRVAHKRTFYWLEQIILKHNAHAETTNIIEVGDGLDFFFNHLQKCRRFCDFLSQFVPLRFTTSRKLISFDEKSATAKHKDSFSVEIAPICKDDLVALPTGVAHRHGTISPFVLCVKVTNSLHFIDCNSLQHAEINAFNYFKEPFEALCGAKALIPYVVLDVELTGASWGKYALADVEVARESEFGNGQTFITRTHLGRLLQPGDTVMGYDVRCLAFNPNATGSLRNLDLPDVVLVKKFYRKRSNRRIWKLKRLNYQVDPFARVRPGDERRRENDYEQFLNELEEDKDRRADINLYADRRVIMSEQARMAEKARRRAAKKAAPTSMDADDMDNQHDDSDESDDSARDEDDEDFPEVKLTELLEDLSIRDDESVTSVNE